MLTGSRALPLFLNAVGGGVICLLVGSALLCGVAVANPLDSTAWTPTPGIGYDKALAIALAAGVVLCGRCTRLTQFCIKASGHAGFCRLEWRDVLPTGKSRNGLFLTDQEIAIG